MNGCLHILLQRYLSGLVQIAMIEKIFFLVIQITNVLSPTVCFGNPYCLLVVSLLVEIRKDKTLALGYWLVEILAQMFLFARL